MHSTTTGDRPQTADPRSAPRATDAQVRTLYNAVRTLVPTVATLSLDDLLGVTRLEPDAAVAAMDRLRREGPLSIHPVDADDAVWLVCRTDR